MSAVANVIFGHIVLHRACKLDDNGDLLLGGYSVTYDSHGREIRRTEPEYYVRVTY